MGFFGKIFKSIGKVFTSIGKVIKKAFTAVGKFTNKLGIVGQIGMMFIMPAIGGLAMKGLTTLGSGFMTGLNAAAQGTGALSGVAKVTHGIFSTVAKIASSGMKIFDTITGAVKGTLGNIAKAVGKTLGFSPTESISTTFRSAANVFDGRPVTADPYAIVGKVATPDPYGILGKGISLDDVYGDIDPSKGLIGAAPRVSRGPPPPADTTPLSARIWGDATPTDAKKAIVDFDVSASADLPKYEITEVPIPETVPTGGFSLKDTLKSAGKQAVGTLVRQGVGSLMAPETEYVEEEPSYAQFIDTQRNPGIDLLTASIGHAAPLGSLQANVVDWNSTFNSNPVYAEEINRGGYLAQMDNAYTDWLKTGVIPSQPSNLVV